MTEDIAPYERYKAPTREPRKGKSRAEKQRTRNVGAKDPRVAERVAGLLALIERMKPVPQRTLFYRATASLPEHYRKEAGRDGNGKWRTASEIAGLAADKLAEDVNVLRRQGRISWEDVTDDFRRRSAPGFHSVHHALAWLSRGYQQDYWAEAPRRIAVTVESEQLMGALASRLPDLQTPLYGLGGQPSVPLKAELSSWLGVSDERAIVLHVGDHDGMGYEIEDSLRAGLEEHGVDADVRRILMSGEQGSDLGLAMRIISATGKDKEQDVAWGFEPGDPVYEAESLDTDPIAALIRKEVDRLLDPDALAEVQPLQDAARKRFQVLADAEAA